jgi:hypothetical protein
MAIFKSMALEAFSGLQQAFELICTMSRAELMIGKEQTLVRSAIFLSAFHRRQGPTNLKERGRTCLSIHK